MRVLRVNPSPTRLCCLWRNILLTTSRSHPQFIPHLLTLPSPHYNGESQGRTLACPSPFPGGCNIASPNSSCACGGPGVAGFLLLAPFCPLPTHTTNSGNLLGGHNLHLLILSSFTTGSVDRMISGGQCYNQLSSCRASATSNSLLLLGVCTFPRIFLYICIFKNICSFFIHFFHFIFHF